MILCINPNCRNFQKQTNSRTSFCKICGITLLLENRYWVTRLLSNDSGFGIIYEAEDAGIPKILKVLKQDLNTDSKFVELFQKEAEVLSRLTHPGIPKVDGYFTVTPRNSQQPLHCIVMEKIDGLNLDEWMQQQDNQPISQKQALEWLYQITEILDLIHNQQYFHRDIKPSNIMRRENGQLALIDFGTAREMTATYLAKVGGAQRLTGIVSAGFTPQEQINGKAVPQSDFYALGRTFVYLLTGKYPTEFAEDPHNGQLLWHKNATHISQQLADFINYLSAPFQGNRPKNALEILQQLEQISRELNKPVIIHNSSKLISYENISIANTLTEHSDLVNSIAFSPDGQTLATGSSDRTIKIWDVASGQLETTLTGHSHAVKSIAFSPNGQLLASGIINGSIKIWSVSSCQVKTDHSGYLDSVVFVTFSPNGQILASGGSDKNIYLWDASRRGQYKSIVGHSSWVSSVAFSPDGQTLASGSWDKTIKIWDVVSRQLKTTLTGHLLSVSSVAFSPDGQTLVSGSWDKTIKIWDVESGKLKTTLTGHSYLVNSVAFSPDEQTLASGSSDKTIKIWDVESGRLETTLTEHTHAVKSVAFSPDGQTLASGSDDKTIKIWRVQS